MRHKRAIPHRGVRVADQIQRDLGELIRELKDPLDLVGNADTAVGNGSFMAHGGFSGASP